MGKTGFSPSHFFHNQLSNTKIFTVNYQVSQKPPRNISVANITEDYQEYFYMEKWL